MNVCLKNRMIKCIKKIISLIISILIVLSISIIVSAQDSLPTDTFTHWTMSDGQKKAVAMPPLYEADSVISARSLGFDKDFGNIEFVTFDRQGDAYILTDAGRILRLNSNYELICDYKITDRSGNPVDFTGAKGIYVYSEAELYIADTAHARVLYCVDGVVQKEILLPKTALIPDNFVFKPTRIVRNAQGYLYVLSEGSYYGAILYNPNGEFSGFFGSNTVKGNILSSLEYLWDRLTMNDVKRAQVSKTLPFQFSDICLDEKGFVYTSTGLNSDDSVGQIRMLSPGGDGILSGAESFNFGETDKVVRMDNEIRQNFTGIQSDGNGLIYALDSGFGLIYIYDTEGNIVAAFGGGVGQGKQTGVFSAANSIAVNGSRIMVSDSLRGTVTFFERTEYGEILCTAQELTMNSNYNAARPLWNKVLEFDPVNRMALLGLAKATYQSGEYSEAMYYAKECNNAELYSQARQKLQNEFISRNFVWLFLLVIALVGGIVVLLVLTKRKQVVLIKNAELRTLTRTLVHPFESFNDVKYKQMGSLKIAFILTFLFYLSGSAATIWSDFRYTSYDSASYNTLFQIVRTIGLVAVWSLANWGISTLQNGKGRLKEVFIVTAYSVFPIILYNLISIPLTHIVASSESTLISGLHILALIFSAIILTVGLMIIHDYSFPRFLITAFISLLFIILIIFVVFMIGILLTQFWSFFAEVILEAIRRF